MTNDDLIELFTKPPASFAWSHAANGSRVMGTSEGVALDLWPDHIDMTAIFPSDRPDIAARSGVLMQLLVTAMRPQWETGPNWLAQQMKLAARSKRAIYEELNVVRQVSFAYYKATGQATLKVLRADKS